MQSLLSHGNLGRKEMEVAITIQQPLAISRPSTMALTLRLLVCAVVVLSMEYKDPRRCLTVEPIV